MMSQYSNTKSRSMKEWTEIYERKTGEKVMLPTGFVLYWLPKRGFAQFKVDAEGSMLMLYQVCGDIHFWHDMGKLMCMQNNLNHLATICTRDVYAYMRIFNWEIVEAFDVDDAKRFICRDDAGCKVVLTQKTYGDKENLPSYWVTQYLHERV